jgi:arylsulfatase A-like enzyme
MLKNKVVFLILLLLGIAQISWSQEKPNVLILFVDDLGYHDLSCHGSEIYQTPNIDKLSTESVRFTNAYANYPRCVPSRYALMTGKYPISKGGVPEGGFDMGEVEDEQNFVKQFKEKGYRTAFFGKWHLGHGSSGPEAFGYDHSVAAGDAGSPISYFYPFNEPKGYNKKVKKAPIPMNFSVPLQEGDYLTDKMTEELLHFVQTAEKDSVPFFALMSFYAVHQPLEAKKKDVQRNRKEIDTHDFGEGPEYIPEGTGRTKLWQDNPNYAGMVENLDLQVGKVLDYLEQSGLDKNTLIVFSSDHGGLSNDGTRERNLATSNAPLRAGKGWVYEGGIKVPLFFRDPYKKQGARDEHSIVMLMDLMPTLNERLGNQSVEKVDGQSFLSVLNEREEWNKRTVFWHASKARPKSTGESKYSAVRCANWKLIHFYEEDVYQLFDLEKDPFEQHDLSEKKKIKKRKLIKKLNEWKKSF